LKKCPIRIEKEAVGNQKHHFTSEAAGQQVKHMAGTSDVNAVGRKEDKINDQSVKTCFRCGKAGHFSRDP